MNKIILRAITAFSRTDLKSCDDPINLKGREKTWLGKQYVILENENDHALLAVYRCMNRGELKRLKRWQPGLTQIDAKVEVAEESKASKTPAILEIAPIKSAEPKPRTRKNTRKEQVKSTLQTDLFE
jgi:hypothetical protein